MQFNVPGVLATLDAIAKQLSAVVPDLLTVVGQDDATVKAVSNGLIDVEAGLAALSATDGQASALPILQRVSADFNAVFSALSSLPLPPQVGIIFQAARMLVPMVLTIAEIVWPA